MIEVVNNVNYGIDWNSDNKKVLEDRKHYFDMLRRFLIDINAEIVSPYSEAQYVQLAIAKVFKKYKVKFVDIDEIKRVNLDEPEG